MPRKDSSPFPLRSSFAAAIAVAAGIAASPAAYAQQEPAGPGWNLSTLQALQAEHADEVIDLAQAWRLVVLHDPEYQAALSARAAAETERRQGRAALLPQVQAGHSRSRITGMQTQYDRLGIGRDYDLDYDSTSTYIQLQQPLFNLGRFAEYKRGHARADLGFAEFLEREQATALRLAEVYLEALRTQAQWELARDLAVSLEAQAVAQEKLFERNEGSRIDAQETRARLALARSEEIRRRDARDVALRELESMVGRPVKKAAGLAGRFEPYPLEPRTQAEWMQRARQFNPAVQVARERVRIAETELQRATGRYFPAVDLVAGYSKADSENLSSLSQRSNTWTVGLHASIPLFSGGYDSANRARAAAALEQARQELRAAEEAAEAQAVREYTAVVGGEARVRALEAAVTSAEQGLEAARASYAHGLRSNVDVLRSQDRLYEAASRLVDARLQYLRGLAGLNEAVAGPTAEAFDELTARYLLR